MASKGAYAPLRVSVATEAFQQNEALLTALGSSIAGLDEEQVQKRLGELGANIIEPNRRGPKPLADLVRSEAARLIPILESATNK